jgi:hypothetical protein
MQLADFYNKHKGETCLIAGLGPNLNLTPPEQFPHPSFSVNTIFRHPTWKPTYYVGVDERLRVENGAELAEKLKDVPKFIPTPDFDDLQGENFYRFRHRQSGEILVGGQLANQKDALLKTGISYFRVMDAVMQIAWHMGFTTMLFVGVQHKPVSENEPDVDREHFWGLDKGAIPNQSNDTWFHGYKTLCNSMTGVRVLNISADTYVPEDVLPRDDWRNWISK